MLDVILQSGALILCGVVWRVVRPLGLAADELRRNLTGLVYVLLLPALALLVLWRAPLGLDAVRVAVAAAIGVGLGMGLAWLWFRGGKVPSAAFGALVLAAGFPNATYLGLPVLEASLGPWARSVAIQYDLFACTPLLLSVGIVLASRFGEGEPGHPVRALMKVPPLWAAIAGVALNAGGVPLPEQLADWLDLLADSVVPLMLFALGLGLSWQGGWRGQIPLVVPVAAIQLLITPFVIWWVAQWLGLGGEMLIAVVLEAAMPSMVLGIVLCDRFRLDAGLYAMSVTVTTALSLLTLPFWFDLLS